MFKKIAATAGAAAILTCGLAATTAPGAEAVTKKPTAKQCMAVYNQASKAQARAVGLYQKANVATQKANSTGSLQMKKTYTKQANNYNKQATHAMNQFFKIKSNYSAKGCGYLILE